MSRTVTLVTVAFALFLTAIAPAPAQNAWRLADGSAAPEDAAFTPPTLVAAPVPLYPADAGDVNASLEVVVGLGGKAAVVSVLENDKPALLPLLVEAAEKATFKPAMYHGRPLAVRYELRFKRTSK